MLTFIYDSIPVTLHIHGNIFFLNLFPSFTRKNCDSTDAILLALYLSGCKLMNKYKTIKTSKIKQKNLKIIFFTTQVKLCSPNIPFKIGGLWCDDQSRGAHCCESLPKFNAATWSPRLWALAGDLKIYQSDEVSWAQSLVNPAFSLAIDTLLGLIFVLFSASSAWHCS